jgi:catechol 2,3-dioxygenase-like lactoylglutathione lyase family enzyme
MSFELERLDHVALTVADVDRSIEWYREVLGLEHVHEDEWGRNPAFLTSGSTGLALFPARGSGAPPAGHPDGLAMWHLAFRADRRNFDRAREQLGSRDIDFQLQRPWPRPLDLLPRSGRTPDRDHHLRGLMRIGPGRFASSRRHPFRYP